MDTNYYIDENTLVLEHTLIRLKSDSESMTVPSSFGGYRATAVGSGAVTMEGVRELTFAKGYVELKDRCLGLSTSLEQIHIPESVQTVSEALFSQVYYASAVHIRIDRGLQPAAFSEISRAALPMSEKEWMMPPGVLRRNETEPVRCGMVNIHPPAAVIRREMRILFNGEIPVGPLHTCYKGTIFDSRPCYDFLEGRKESEEYTAVMEMIRDGDPGWHDPAAEQAGDLMIRRGEVMVKPNGCPEVSVAVLEKIPKTPGKDGLYHTRFHLFGTYLFFPAVRRIRHHDNDWWIYSRNFLTSNPECPYLREDVGVFDRDGLITDRRTSEDVYAKFRFLALL